MDRRAELEATLEDDPEDRRAWAVYADYLQELGDPRGELIALSLAAPSDHTLEPDITARQRALVPMIEGKAWHVGWKYGFVRRVVLGVDPELAAAVLAHPSLRFVHELVFNRAQDPSPMIAAIAAAIRPTVRVLDLGMTAGVPWPAMPIELAPIWDALPRLARLVVRESSIDFGSEEVAVGELALCGTTLYAPGFLSAAARVRWPRLERLTIEISGHAATKHEAGEALSTLLATELPALRHLAVRDGILDNGEPSTLAWLRAGRVFDHLESLDLSNNQLGSEDAQILLASRHRFPRLASLDLSRNRFAASSIDRLRTLAPEVRVADQSWPEPDHDYDHDLYDY